MFNLKYGQMKTGIQLIATERRRQIKKWGTTPEHDIDFEGGQLLVAAVYALMNGNDESFSQEGWEKFEENVERDSHESFANLIKAGALIAAEIDRLQYQED